METQIEQIPIDAQEQDETGCFSNWEFRKFSPLDVDQPKPEDSENIS